MRTTFLSSATLHRMNADGRHFNMRPAPFGSTHSINFLRSFSSSFSVERHNNISPKSVNCLNRNAQCTLHRRVCVCEANHKIGLAFEINLANGSITFPNGNHPPIERMGSSVERRAKCICLFHSFVIIMAPQVVPDLPAERMESTENRLRLQ